ncbi:MAG: FKBP-type peptidyl-prolyl cis-trans isomerase [Bifidobacteriaceae bacterium]|jgi:peptidylprolyl isomerase|nr:FKBP-type peptidyl-prolyl cis-trans isomerase [Bifidobacteriaceae bacterium]
MNLTAKIAAAASVALLIAGCGSPSDSLPSIAPMPEYSEMDQQMLSLIEWQEDDGGVPVLLFEPPLDVLEPATRVIWEGDGAEIDEGDPIMFQFVVFDGQDGSVVDSTYEQEEPESLVVTADTTEATLMEALVGLKEGARLIYATPGTYSAEAESGESASPTPTGGRFLAITVELVAELPTEASGEPVPPVEGLPTVSDGENGPTIDIPDTEAPTELISQDLILGTGAGVEEDQTAVVRYTGWLWDGTPFASNWAETTAAALPVSAMLGGWRDGIVGHAVGSRVLTIVPPALGYGGAGNEAVPPGATLVFVTDILGAY